MKNLSLSIGIFPGGTRSNYWFLCMYIFKTRSTHSLPNDTVSVISSMTSDSTPTLIEDHLANLIIYKENLAWKRSLDGINVIWSSQEVRNQIRLAVVCHHENLNRLFGCCYNVQPSIFLWEFCGKHSVADVVKNDNFNFDWLFQVSFLNDIVQVE